MSLSDHFADFPSASRRGEKRKSPKEYTPPVPPPLTREQTLRWLERIKRDDWWQSQMPVSMDALEAVCSRQELALSLKRPEQVDSAVARIAPLIPDIEARKLVFPRRTTPKSGEERAPHFLWLQPPDTPPQIRPYSPQAAWSLWVRCQVCASNKFMPLSCAEVACWSCIKPSQYAGLGTHMGERSLIHEALKKYY